MKHRIYLAPHVARCRPSGPCAKAGTCWRALADMPAAYGTVADFTLDDKAKVGGACTAYVGVVEAATLLAPPAAQGNRP